MKWAMLMLLATTATVPATDFFGDPFASNVPADVRRFVIDRQGCEHFSEEPAGNDVDPKRNRFLEQKVKRLCTGIEQRQQRMLVRYKARPDLHPLITGE